MLSSGEKKKSQMIQMMKIQWAIDIEAAFLPACSAFFGTASLSSQFMKGVYYFKKFKRLVFRRIWWEEKGQG